MNRLERWVIFAITGHRPRRSARRGRRGPARDHRYRAWVRSFPCSACGYTIGIQAAHTGSDGGMRQKSSDYSCVPLCVNCHREYDNGLNSGRAFERLHHLSMAAIVRQLNQVWFQFSRRPHSWID